MTIPLLYFDSGTNYLAGGGLFATTAGVRCNRSGKVFGSGYIPAEALDISPSDITGSFSLLLWWLTGVATPHILLVQQQPMHYTIRQQLRT